MRIENVEVGMMCRVCEDRPSNARLYEGDIVRVVSITSPPHPLRVEFVSGRGEHAAAVLGRDYWVVEPRALEPVTGDHEPVTQIKVGDLLRSLPNG